MEFRALLAAEFRPYAELAPPQLEVLERHYNLLLRWNQRLNLTRIENLEDAVKLHYCESLFLGLQLPKGPLTIADLGSGAGFPGLPVAVLRPDLQVSLIESHQRKAVFLREASLELKNVQVLAMRAEDCRERFDWVLSRAVSPADVLSCGLAPNSALLVAANNAPADSEVIRLPWGDERVPRETLSAWP